MSSKTARAVRDFPNLFNTRGGARLSAISSPRKSSSRRAGVRHIAVTRTTILPPVVERYFGPGEAGYREQSPRLQSAVGRFFDRL